MTLRGFREGETIEHRYQRGEAPPDRIGTYAEGRDIAAAIYNLGRDDIEQQWEGDHHPYFMQWLAWSNRAEGNT